MQPFGPRGADLLLRCTPAAAELGQRRPELLKEKEKTEREEDGKKKEKVYKEEEIKIKMNFALLELHVVRLQMLCWKLFCSCVARDLEFGSSSNLEVCFMGHFDRLKKYNGKDGARDVKKSSREDKSDKSDKEKEEEETSK
eukprot:Skav222070  [mRNA]  locus=scaffold707:338970:342702:- [translate_table: standard]